MDHRLMEELVKKSKDGDSGASLQLLEDFTPFIISTARKLYINGHDLEDLIQIGRLSFLAALSKYDTGREFCFPAYAVNAVKNNYHHLIRKAADRNYEPSSSALEHMTSGEDIEEEYLRRESATLLAKHLDSLTAEDRDLIDWFYFKDGSIKEYADASGQTYNSVVKRKQRILGRLKQAMSAK
ncbi:MAG: Sigma-70 region 2 domain protein [Firmicutes bacterium]|nr:Sigma-70 region 2 domain protein [Bacillota bacterium]